MAIVFGAFYFFLKLVNTDNIIQSILVVLFATLVFFAARNWRKVFTTDVRSQPLPKFFQLLTFESLILFVFRPPKWLIPTQFVTMDGDLLRLWNKLDESGTYEPMLMLYSPFTNALIVRDAEICHQIIQDKETIKPLGIVND
jgi:hypothetical protein